MLGNKLPWLKEKLSTKGKGGKGGERHSSGASMGQDEALVRRVVQKTREVTRSPGVQRVALTPEVSLCV